MKIEYEQNPLKTKVILDEKEKQLLKEKIKYDQLQWAAIELALDIENGRVTKENITSNDSYNKIMDEKIIEEESSNLLENAIEALQSSHGGDCICAPATCPKCYAEELLGICTTKDLDKYAGHYINLAFHAKGATTCQEAIDILKNYNIRKEDNDPEEVYQRWNKNKNDAIKWLEKYQQDYIPVIGKNACDKCHGYGWVFGRQLDENPDFDTMTRYTCDICKGEKLKTEDVI